jgi:hypothetical protein
MHKEDGARPEDLSPLALACLWEAQAARKMLGIANDPLQPAWGGSRAGAHPGGGGCPAARCRWRGGCPMPPSPRDPPHWRATHAHVPSRMESPVRVPEACAVGCPPTSLCYLSIVLSVTSVTPMPPPLVYCLSENIARVSLSARSWPLEIGERPSPSALCLDVKRERRNVPLGPSRRSGNPVMTSRRFPSRRNDHIAVVLDCSVSWNGSALGTSPG